MAIIVSKNGKNAQKVNKSSFDYEDSLQEYIYENPESIPLYDIKEDVRVLILSREFPTNSGPIDAIGIDADGEIYIIETKLYKNSDKRSVVAQVLDYGASLWKRFNDFNEFIRLTKESVSQKFGVQLDDKLKEYFQLDDEALEVVKENIKNNLDQGKFKFIVLMDKVSDRLKDLIIFINENSRFDVYCVELEYYKHEGYEIIIPKLYGAEVKKDVSVSSSKKITWDWDSFKGKLGNFGKDEVIGAQEIIKWSEKNNVTIWWGTNIIGSFIPGFSKFYPFSVQGDAHVSWNAPHQGDKSPRPFNNPEKRREILKRIKQIEGSTVDLDNLSGYSAIKLPLKVLADEKQRGIFFEVCKWIKEEVESNKGKT